MRAALTLFLLFPAVLPADDKPAARKFALSKEERAVLDRTNAERKAAGLPALAANEQLFDAARKHSANMARQSKLDHLLDGTPADRVRAAGYVFRAIGENIAWNQPDAAEVLQSWMESPGHRANLLSREYTETGIAVAVNARGERYWTQVFGRGR